MLLFASVQQVTKYTYDANGNMVSDGEFTYVYNSANQMVEVRNITNGLVEQYWYDTLGTVLRSLKTPPN